MPMPVLVPEALLAAVGPGSLPSPTGQVLETRVAVTVTESPRTTTVRVSGCGFWTHGQTGTLSATCRRWVPAG